MATVTFYSEDRYKNHQRTFSGGYQAIIDLREWDYEDSSYGMSNSINSMKAGDNTWICLFSEDRFSGDTVKINPNQDIPNLTTCKDGDGIGFRNYARSFIMYDKKPNFWDVNDNHSAGDCWVKLYTGKRFTDKCFCLTDANLVSYTGDLKDANAGIHTRETMNTACVTGYRTWTIVTNPNGGTYKYYNYNYPKSLTTGPRTWVRLYKKIGFETKIAQFGPNSLIPDLSKYGSADVNSIRVYNVEPGDWEGSSATIPDMVLTIEKYQTAQKFEYVLAGLIGCIPYIGSLPAGILNVLWPTSPSTQEIWKDLDNYMKTLATGLIDQDNVIWLNNTLEGLGKAIKSYSDLLPSPEKAEWLGNILTALDEDKPYFYSVEDPEKNLTYMVEFGTMTILMLAERVYNYTTLCGNTNTSDPNYGVYTKKLDDSITEFTNAATAAKNAAIDWRIGLITVTRHGIIANNYTLNDAYTGYSTEYKHQLDAETAQAILVQQVKAQYEMLLEAKISPSYIWHYLRTSNTTSVESSGNDNFPTTKFNEFPKAETIHVTTGTYGQTGDREFKDDSNGGKITGMTLYTDGKYLTGFQCFFENQLSGIHGWTGTTAVAVNFEEDEFITSIYGGSGTVINQFFIRTTKGREFGVGGSGGNSYVAAPPQGVGKTIELPTKGEGKTIAVPATVTSISGWKNNNQKVISQLTINWSYQTWK